MKQMTIATAARHSFDKIVAKLARSARKLGLQPEPSVDYLWATKREVPTTRITLAQHEDGVQETSSRYLTEVVDANVTLPEFGAATGDWRLLGIVNRTDGEENEIICQPADIEPMEAYRTAHLTCAHCHKSRRRVHGIVVQRKDGLRSLLGVECGQFYIGDPAAAVAQLEFQALIVSSFSVGGEGDYWSGDSDNTGKLVATHDLALTANFCAYATRVYGYCPTYKHDNYGGRELNKDATSIRVRAMLVNKNEALLQEITADDQALADKVVAWAAAYEGDDMFMLAAKAMVSREWITDKGVGLCASLFPGYERMLQRERDKSSQHVSEPGKRIDVDLTVYHTRSLDSAFGTKQLIKARDAAGNVFVWFASTACLSIGEKLVGKATVKKHDVYDDIKQTVISRFAEPKPKKVKKSLTVA